MAEKAEKSSPIQFRNCTPEQEEKYQRWRDKAIKKCMSPTPCSVFSHAYGDSKLCAVHAQFNEEDWLVRFRHVAPYLLLLTRS